MIRFLAACLMSTLCLCASAAEAVQKPRKICLALSGGGARGFAHIGVLKTLEQMHIPIDCIAGTSMGAVIGGLYAAGMSATEIEQRLSKLKLDDIALDRVERRNLPQALRDEDERYPLGATVGVSGDGVRLPTGAVQATQFLELLQNWTAHLPPDLNFDHLPIPFRTVATDLETGAMVQFEGGPLHLAIRASMAAPGVFAPIEVNGRLLADGGLVRNLPVDIAKSMGADVVIAVNIGTPLMPRTDLQNWLKISQQMLHILTEQNVVQQKELLGREDILIEPDLGNISFLDFTRATEAAAIGTRAALTQQSRLAALSLPENEYIHRQLTGRMPQLPPIAIAFIDVENNGAIPKADIVRQLEIRVGDRYDAEAINNKLATLNSSREYDSVSHELIRRDGQYGVLIHANGRNWGPHFLRFGLALSSGFDNGSGYQLQIGHRRPWLTDGGLEWRNDIKLGNVLAWRSELRQPVTVREGTYLATYFDAGQSPRNYYQDNNRIAQYTFRDLQYGIDLAIPLGPQSRLGEFRIGPNLARYRISPVLGAFVQSTLLEQTGIRASLVLDQLDTPSFPRHGYKLDGSATIGTRGSQDRFDQYDVNGAWAISSGKHSLDLRASASALTHHTQQNDVVGIGATLGGFQQLSAFQPEQFAGNYKLYGSATWLLRTIDFSMAGQSMSFGSSLEIGNVWNRRDDISLSSLHKSASLFVGFNSLLGPIYIGFAFGDSGAKSVFFQMGRQ